MKKIIMLLLISIILSNCGGSRAIYGVPAEQWERMDETERQATVELFNRQEAINAQTRVQAEKAKQEAEEIAKQCHEDRKIDPSKCRTITQRKFGF